MKVNKRQLNIISHKIINPDIIKILLLSVPMIVVFINSVEQGAFNVKSFLNINILVSFIFVFLCEFLANLLLHIIERYTEDSTKVTDDYEGVVKRYSLETNNMIQVKEGMNGNQKKDIIYPVEMLFLANKDESVGYRFVYNSCPYKVPELIEDNASKILEAHKQSFEYGGDNRTVIRMDDFSIDKNGERNILNIEYSFTTYMNTLLTNRAIDYPFLPHSTLRNIYEPGPFMNRLKESKLSNHIGYKGLVRFNDGKVAFVRRNGNVSISKRKWAPLVTPELKTRFVLNKDRELTLEGIANAISEEINEKLLITVKDKKKLEKSIIGFYRDFVEGGKPHFVFYYECDQIDSEEFTKRYESKQEELKKKKSSSFDGSEIVCFSLESLGRAEYTIDGIIVDGKRLSMNPSTICSILMILDYLGYLHIN